MSDWSIRSINAYGGNVNGVVNELMDMCKLAISAAVADGKATTKIYYNYEFSPSVFRLLTYNLSRKGIKSFISNEEKREFKMIWD